MPVVASYLRRTSIILLALAFASPAIATEYLCRDGNIERRISVEYEHKGWKVPCKVKYDKSSEGVIDYPWSAETTVGYCEDRAEFLAAKLENWGWVCRRVETEETP